MSGLLLCVCLSLGGFESAQLLSRPKAAPKGMERALFCSVPAGASRRFDSHARSVLWFCQATIPAGDDWSLSSWVSFVIRRERKARFPVNQERDNGTKSNQESGSVGFLSRLRWGFLGVADCSHRSLQEVRYPRRQIDEKTRADEATEVNVGTSLPGCAW